ncbi:MAG: hypothetical protein KVP17_005284, partial [Porospora cf. gigantea B]|uniref:uncharacterized protein n=1 Tax=Porospora cf. gigantea B TaxID=2853592 RepID=UPI0035718EC2
MTRFCFTDHDTTTTHVDIVIAWLKSLTNLVYCIIAREKAPTTGHLHLQGFINVHGLRFSSLKKKLPKAHVEMAKGSDVQNQVYCSKEGKDRSNCFRYERIVRSMMAHQRRIVVEESGVVQPKEIVILFGNTGTGKTSTARAEANGAIYQVFNPRWFDGFEDGHHQTILFDEFNGQMPIEELLQLTDRWPVTREIKGGTTFVNPGKVIFTSNMGQLGGLYCEAVDHPESRN